RKQPITGRPAELLKPEWDELRTHALALKGCNGTDEDVLTYAMFPQVAPKFFASRAEGPKNVGKKPAEAAPAAAARPADGRVPVSGPVTYEVRIGDRSHKVTVRAARPARSTPTRSPTRWRCPSRPARPSSSSTT